MITGRGVCLWLALWPAFPSLLVFGQAGEPPRQEPPQYRAGVALVPVDVRVVDKVWNPVPGLTAADFTIYDNNVRQQIAHFLPQSVPSAPRTFVLALGCGRLNDRGRALDALIEFVRSKTQPQDRVGVVAYFRATAVTTDHEAVARLLVRYRDRHESIEQEIVRDLKEVADVPLSEETRSSIDALYSAPGIPAVQVLPGAIGARGYFYASDALRLIRAIQFSSGLEGEKHLVFVSERPLPAGLSDTRHAKLAAATRVVLSLVQTGGVQTAAGQGPNPAALIGPNYRAAAEQSGGLASVYENPAVLLARLARMTSDQYLLGYYPSTPPAENAFGSLRVVVNRPGLTILHRHRYLTKTRFDEADLRRFFLEARVEGAVARLRKPPATAVNKQPPGIKLSALVTPGAAGEVQVKVELAFDPAKLIFTQQGNDLLARRDLVVVVDGRDQNELARSTDRLEIRLDAREYARQNPKWLEHLLSITVKGNPVYAHAVLYDYDTDTATYETVRVRR